LFSYFTYLMLQHYLAKEQTPEDSALVHCACNTVQLLKCYLLAFSWSMPPTAPSWMHWLEDLGSHRAARVWVVSQKDWRNQALIGWILAFEWKMQFSCFPVLPDSAETQGIWGGIVKHRLIAYFISYICAKKYQNLLTCFKVIASQRWDDVFEAQSKIWLSVVENLTWQP